MIAEQTMSPSKNTKELSRRDFLKLLGIGTGAALVSCSRLPDIMASPSPAATLTSAPHGAKARFRLCFNVEYKTNPDIDPAAAGKFDPTRGLTGELDTALDYQTFTFTVAELKAQLPQGAARLESIGIIPDGATFDSELWVSVDGWPRDVNVLWVSDITLGKNQILTSSGHCEFAFRNFSQNYDDMDSPMFPFGTYATNGIRSATEGVNGGPCVKYIIAGAAGASWMIYKEPFDLNELANTDTLQISMKLGSNAFEKWLPAPLAAPSASTPPPTYEIGPGKQYETLSDMPWESLQAGDIVYIYWRPEPYQEKIGIDVQGTAEKPVIVHGVPGPDNQLPKIDGNHAVTRQTMRLGGQNNRLVGIGTNERPSRHVIIENLEIFNANKFKMFYPKGQVTLKAYNEFCAGVYVQWGESITVRNCVIHDCANGLFVNSFSNLDYYSGRPVLESEVQYASRDILVEGNHFYRNGVPGKMFEHHTYSAAINTIYQFNHYGPLLNGSTGYALKDRGSGTVIRYNWIEDGRRQISLDDAQDCPLIAFDPHYIDSYVYGNILIEQDGGFRVWGDDEIIHFGGDDENALDRTGVLYFWNNTVVSYRTKATYIKYTTASWAAGRMPRTCLFYLPVRDQTANVQNNIFYQAGDAPLTIMNDGGTDNPSGVVQFSHNWISEGWFEKMEGTGTIQDDGTNLTGADPGFANLAEQDFHLAASSPCIGQAQLTAAPPAAEYVKDMQRGERLHADDLGAYEAQE